MTGNTTGKVTFAQGQLRALVERIERLEEEKATITADVREVYAEAKANGFDTKILRKLVSLRKKDANERQEEAAMLDVYLAAMGMDQPSLYDAVQPENPDKTPRQDQPVGATTTTHVAPTSPIPEQAPGSSLTGESKPLTDETEDAVPGTSQTWTAKSSDLASTPQGRSPDTLHPAEGVEGAASAPVPSTTTQAAPEGEGPTPEPLPIDAIPPFLDRRPKDVRAAQ